jgi:hypothetical protein
MVPGLRQVDGLVDVGHGPGTEGREHQQDQAGFEDRAEPARATIRGHVFAGAFVRHRPHL